MLSRGKLIMFSDFYFDCHGAVNKSICILRPGAYVPIGVSSSYIVYIYL